MNPYGDVAASRWYYSASASDRARKAFSWAISKGAIDGRDGKLAAGESVTRAEAAIILERFYMLGV